MLSSKPSLSFLHRMLVSVCALGAAGCMHTPKTYDVDRLIPAATENTTFGGADSASTVRPQNASLGPAWDTPGSPASSDVSTAAGNAQPTQPIRSFEDLLNRAASSAENSVGVPVRRDPAYGGHAMARSGQLYNSGHAGPAQPEPEAVATPLAEPSDMPSRSVTEQQVAEIRRLMNEGSVNAMSTGAVLSERTELLPSQVTILGPSSPESANNSPRVRLGAVQPMRAPETAVGDGLVVPDPVQPARNALSQSTGEFAGPRNPFPLGVDTEADPNSGGADNPTRSEEVMPESSPETSGGETTAETSEPQRTVFDRLRNLYPSAEARETRELFRRQFERLQPPWARARQEQPETAPVNPEPEAPAVAPGDIASPELSAGRDQLLQQLIEAAERDLAEWPRAADGGPIDNHQHSLLVQDLRLLRLIAGSSEAALASSVAAGTGRDDFWQDLMLALNSLRAENSDTARANLADAVRRLRSAARLLEREAPLEISRIELCRRVRGFGSVDSFPAAGFRPGQPVLLYTELQNVGTQITTDGVYRSRCQITIQVLSEGDDEPLEMIPLPELIDDSTSRRSDYFHTYELTIPSHLSRGSYRFRVVLRDMIGRKASTAEIPFTVR